MSSNYTALTNHTCIKFRNLGSFSQLWVSPKPNTILHHVTEKAADNAKRGTYREGWPQHPVCSSVAENGKHLQDLSL